MGNEDTLSTEPVLNNNHETDLNVSQVCNYLNENMSDSPLSEVKNYKLENPKDITIGHLKVNSLRNKLISIEELIKSKIDIFLVSETKINHSFPNQQLEVNHFGRGQLF